MKKLFIILLSVVLFINIAIAQTTSVEILPARISKINGHVILKRASATSEELGIVNLPIEAGDSLFVKEGYIDIDVEDGSTIRLWERSNTVFLNVGNTTDDEISTLLYSYMGKYELFTPSGNSFIDVETKTGIITAFPNSVLIVDVSEDGNIKIEVISGSGAYKTPNEEKTITAGDVVELSSSGYGTIYNKPTTSNSNNNNQDLNNSSPSREYIPKKLHKSSSSLDDNGSWVWVSSQGYCWKPTRSNWRPYKHGEWVWTSSWGYTWVSYEPWGWVTSHYGYWHWSRKHGWIWIPGSTWCNARVVWIWGNGYVGWYPYPYYNWYGWFPWWYPYNFWYCVSYHSFYSPSYRYHNPYYGWVDNKPPHRYDRIDTPDRISDISTESPDRPETSTERRIPEITDRITENPTRPTDNSRSNITDNSRIGDTNNSRSGNNPSRPTDNSNNNTNNSRSGYTPSRPTTNTSRTYTRPTTNNPNNNSRTNTQPTTNNPNNNTRTNTQPTTNNPNNNSRTNDQPTNNNPNNNSRTNDQPTNNNPNNNSRTNDQPTNNNPNNNSRTNDQPTNNNPNNNSRTNERPTDDNNNDTYTQPNTNNNSNNNSNNNPSTNNNSRPNNRTNTRPSDNNNTRRDRREERDN